MDITFKGARGSGRTTMLVNAVNQYAVDNPGSKIHFWVPMAAQVKRVFEMFKALEEPSICRYILSPRAELSYTNGSDVVFLSGQQHMRMSYWDAKDMAVAFDDSEYTYRDALLPVYQNTKTRWFVVEDKYKTWRNHPNELSESYYKEA